MHLTENIFNIFFLATPVLLFIQSLILSTSYFKHKKFSICLSGIFILLSISSVLLFKEADEPYHLEEITVQNSNKIFLNIENKNLIDSHLNHIEKNDTDLQIELQYSDTFISYLTEIEKSIEYGNDSILFNKNDIIAINTLNGEEYFIEQLADTKLFIPYKENDKEVFFYGCCNNGYLDGDCIFNIYNGDKLITLLEATYKDGKLLSYKRVNNSKTQVGIITWNISYRVIETGYNSGVTLNYFKNDDYIKDFDFESAKPSDILYVNDFENNLKEVSILEGYYSGNTSNGYYNDNTGNAYLIKFFEDGTVRMLYHGNFCNGYPDDNTGNAWNIVKNKNTNYMYYMGCFKNGSTTNNIGFIFENNLSLERINELLKGNNWEDNNYEYELNWDFPNVNESKK